MIIKKTLAGILLILFFLPAIRSQEKTNRLTLDDVIYIAQQQSPDALIAKHRFRRSFWEFKRYKANYLPMLSLEGNLPTFNRSIDIITQPDGTELYKERQFANTSLEMSVRQTVGFTGGEFFLRSGLQRQDNITDSVTNTSYLSTPVNLGYSQPIFQFNPYKWDKKIEPLKYRQAKKEYLENLEEVSITAINYFFNLLLAQIEKEIAHKNLLNYDTLYKIAEGRFVLGKIAENELLQLELNYLKAEAAVENAELELENNLFRLRSFLRINKEEPVELIPPTNIDFFDVSAAKAIEEAKENASSSMDFKLRLMEAEREVNRAKMDGRFDAELYAVFGLTQTGDLLPDAYRDPQDQQQVSLGINIPILDWGLAKGTIKMAESSQELIRTSVEQEQIDFEQNIFLTVMKFNMQQNQLYIAAKSDTVAQKRYDVTKKRYMIGKVNDVLELNNAQIDNDNAKKDYFRALKGYWTNYYEIRKLTLYDFENDKVIDFSIDEIGYID
ncbi:MAG: TolC family protein [Bacteroidales bacterium]